VFQKELNYLFGVSEKVLNYLFETPVVFCKKSRVFAVRIMGFPQELETVRFNLEPKLCKSVSLSAKRSVFTLVGLSHGVVTEKLRFPYKFIYNL